MLWGFMPKFCVSTMEVSTPLQQSATTGAGVNIITFSVTYSLNGPLFEYQTPTCKI